MKRQVLSILGLFVCIIAFAVPISRMQAQQKAKAFLLANGRSEAVALSLSMKQTRRTATDEQAYYYVFNVGEQQGFVVVSGDDRTDEVLGYADEGEISATDMPDNLRAWLEGYADQIKWLDEHPDYVNKPSRGARAIQQTVRHPIAPLLTCRWNQNEPYNLYCPTSNGTRTVTGCVATAMAQMMYYHRNEALTSTVATIPAYKTATLGIKVSAISPTTIDWDNMQDVYAQSEDLSDASNEAVAKLMMLAGASLRMDYNVAKTGGSGAYTQDVPQALINYFGYDNDTKYVSRNSYTYADWQDVIYRELLNGPVVYNGQSGGGGHCFVCDGYSYGDFYHINWGWGGSSNGYFKLSLLDTSEQGIGGSSTDDGFSFMQGAVIDVQPVDDGIDHLVAYGPMQVFGAWADETSVTRTSAGDNFTITPHFAFYNITGAAGVFDFAWSIYQDDEFITDILTEAQGTALNNQYGYSDWYETVSFGAGLTDGTYKLISRSRAHGTDTFLPDLDSNRFYLKLVIAGNKMTIEPMGSCTFDAQLALEGEAKTDQPINVRASVTCTDGFYSGDMILCIVEGNNISKLLGGKLVELKKGETEEWVFTFTCSDAGTYLVCLLDKDYYLVSAFNLTVQDGTVTSGDLSFQEITINSPKTQYGIYGKQLKATIKLKNNSTTEDSNAGVVVGIAKRGYSSLLSYYVVPTSIAKGATGSIDIEFNDLDISTQFSYYDYYIYLFYVEGDLIDSQPVYRFLCYPAVTTYKADGSITFSVPTSVVTVADDVVAVDVSGLTTVSQITPNVNPNTLYFVDGSAVPAGLSGKNVVKDGVCASLQLADGYDFYTPADFEATVATYTRQFSTGADGAKGWSTLVLPFDVQTVKQGNKTLDWFRSASDTGKHFWLKSFVSDEEDEVYFDHAASLQANTPYLIAVPGNRWGEVWNLTNKDITFQGSNVNIDHKAVNAITGKYFMYEGYAQAQNLTNAYVLNDEGSAFLRSAAATVEPFRAAFLPLGNSQVNVLPILSLDNPVPTGISETATTSSTAAPVYNLQGMRVDTSRRSATTGHMKGLYIQGGKKVLVK
jgi:hypothetical protein